MTHSFASPQNCNICHEDKTSFVIKLFVSLLCCFLHCVVFCTKLLKVCIKATAKEKVAKNGD